jgi:hypothetical protein
MCWRRAVGSLILQISNVKAANTNRSATLDATTQIEFSLECEQGRSRLQSAKTAFARKSSSNLGERCSAGVPDVNKSLGRFVSLRELKRSSWPSKVDFNGIQLAAHRSLLRGCQCVVLELPPSSSLDPSSAGFCDLSTSTVSEHSPLSS